MDTTLLYEHIAQHAAELGSLADLLRQEITARAAQEIEKAEAQRQREAQQAAQLAERRLAETEDALNLLDPAWCAAFPELRDLVRAELATWQGFETSQDLLVNLPETAALSPIRVEFARTSEQRSHRFTAARLANAASTARYFNGRYPRQEPSYEKFFVVKSLEECLYWACQARLFFNQWTAAHAAWQADEDHRLAAIEADRQPQQATDQANQLEQQAAAAEQSIETERLLFWVRSDPAVINLVRAFIAIEEQRQSFDERLEYADAADSDAWKHCETKSAELLRQAEEARREAARQREEARRYEDEADEARKKIKDAERRADSYYYRRYDY